MALNFIRNQILFSLLFRRKPPLDEASLLWLFDVFGWCFRNFSPAVFYQQTRLVLPTNDFFPGKVDSIQGMAELVFDQVAEYAGMRHWPWQVVEQSHCYRESGIVPSVGAGQAFPGARQLTLADGKILPVVYDMRHIGNPETLIAGFAHRLGQYLGQTAQEPPPGGVENWPQATEVVAAYLGFGLMFANSAFVFPSGGCGSCATSTSRDNALSQWDSTYALALFTVLKGISPRLVRSHLKKSLRGYFSRCVADVASRERLVQRLQSMVDVSGQLASGRAQA